MARSSGASPEWQRFQAAVSRAVEEMGGDRAAANRTKIKKAIWYDTKKGRSMPDATSTWPSMKNVLTALPVAVTGVRDWQALYDRVQRERGRPLHTADTLHDPASVATDRDSCLPPDTGHLVGRSEMLERILDVLRRDSVQAGTSTVVALHGMGGVGKTALATRAARQLADLYPDRCLFIDLHSHTPATAAVPASEALDRLLRQLGVPGEQIPRHLDDRAALFRERLAGRRVLLVADDARDVAQVRALLPAQPSCAALITSRNRLAALDEAHHLAIEPLPAAGSRALFETILGACDVGPRDPQVVDRVVKACGHLPSASPPPGSGSTQE
jgi:hypothetical protein